MKILHVVSSVHRAGGGVSEVIPHLCRALKAYGQDVVLATAGADFEMSDAAYDAERYGVVFKQYPRSQLLRPLALSPWLKHDLDKLIAESDIVHLHGLWQAPCWYAAAECLRQHKPYVMMPHGFLKQSARTGSSKWKKRIVGFLFDKRYLKSAKALVATSENEIEGYRQFGLKNPVHIMPIGLDCEHYHLADFHTFGTSIERKKKLLFFSRVSPIKGLDMLVQAWKRLERLHNEWDLVITGPDDRGYTRELQSYITSLGLTYKDETSAVNLNPQPQPSVIFTGPVYGDAKYTALRSADAFVLSSRSENWSIAVAEAMASGLPVVCTKGAPWSCVNDCGAGCWVDISVDAIAEGLCKVLSASNNTRHQMGICGRSWVAENLTWSKIAKDMVAFYENIR